MNVFVSYRRDDSALAAKLLHGELARHFGVDGVFMDIDGIGYGDDFVAAIDRRLARADVVVVVVGPQWLEMLHARAGGADWVREEVRRSLALRAATGRPRVIPVLVDGAAMPGDGLPGDLAALRSLNMLRLDPRALNEGLNALVEAAQDRRFDAVADELRRRWRTRVAAVAAGVPIFFAGWVSAFDLLGLDTRAATATMLLSAALPGAPAAPWNDSVTLVAIDEQSVSAVGTPFGAAWRNEHARLLQRALDAGARAVAFDMTFAVAGPAAADDAFATALAAVQRRMPVVVGVQEMDGDEPRIVQRLRGLVDWGLACAGQRFGLAHSMPLVAVRTKPAAAAGAGEAPRSHRMPLPSLATAAFAAGGRVDPPDDEQQRLQRLTVLRGPKLDLVELRFSTIEDVAKSQPGCPAIRPGDRVASQLIDPGALPRLDQPPRRVAYEAVLRGEAAALAALAGRIVLVGVLLGDEDRFDVGGGERRFGAELMAAHIDTMAASRPILPPPWAVQATVAVLLALAGAVVAMRLRARSRLLRASALAGLGAGFVAATVVLLRTDQVLLGVPYGIAAIAIGAWLAGRLYSGGLR